MHDRPAVLQQRHSSLRFWYPSLPLVWCCLVILIYLITYRFHDSHMQKQVGNLNGKYPHNLNCCSCSSVLTWALWDAVLYWNVSGSTAVWQVNVQTLYDLRRLICNWSEWMKPEWILNSWATLTFLRSVWRRWKKRSNVSLSYSSSFVNVQVWFLAVLLLFNCPADAHSQMLEHISDALHLTLWC